MFVLLPEFESNLETKVIIILNDMPYLIASTFTALMLFEAVALAAAGHGWVTGAWGSLALAPIVFVAWVNALHTRPLRALAYALLAAGTLILAGVAVGTMTEGVAYLFALASSWGIVLVAIATSCYLNWVIAWWVAISRSRPPASR